MINKIIWTKTNKEKTYNGLSFSLPSGYKITTIYDYLIYKDKTTAIDLGVSIYSEQPIVLMFSKALTAFDFYIIDCHQIIPAHTSTDLSISVINPFYKEEDNEPYLIKEQSYIANMIVMQSTYTNLFEVSNSVYKKYV